jgi:hypothetical protein
MHLIHNEQIKLRATFATNVGIGLMVAGAAVPFIQAVGPGMTPIAFFGLVPWFVGIGSHLWGVQHLKQLREEPSAGE